jgi:hypothetical protein
MGTMPTRLSTNIVSAQRFFAIKSLDLREGFRAEESFSLLHSSLTFTIPVYDEFTASHIRIADGSRSFHQYDAVF